MAKNDADSINPGDIFKLKDLNNVKLEKDGKELIGMFDSRDIKPKTKKLHWVSSNNVSVDLVVPGILFKNKNEVDTESLKFYSGLGEVSLCELKEGDIIQFERVGYAKIEKITKNSLNGILTQY